MKYHFWRDWSNFVLWFSGKNTVVHDFNGHEVNGIHELYGKKGYDKALYSVNNRYDITKIHDINLNFPYDNFFRKNNARLYLLKMQSFN